MARVKVHIRNAGLQEIKRSAQVREVHRLAVEAVADNVRNQGIKVGDRNGGPDEIPLPVAVRLTADVNGAKGAVILDHPAGKAVQAKHGSLTKAAAQAGLHVRGPQ